MLTKLCFDVKLVFNLTCVVKSFVMVIHVPVLVVIIVIDVAALLFLVDRNWFLEVGEKTTYIIQKKKKTTEIFHYSGLFKRLNSSRTNSKKFVKFSKEKIRLYSN